MGFCLGVFLINYFANAESTTKWNWRKFNVILPHYAANAPRCVELKQDAYLRDGDGDILIWPENSIVQAGYMIRKINPNTGKPNRVYIQSSGPRMKFFNRENGKFEALYYIWGGSDEGKVANGAKYSGFVRANDIEASNLPQSFSNLGAESFPEGSPLEVAEVIPRKLEGFVPAKEVSKKSSRPSLRNSDCDCSEANHLLAQKLLRPMIMWKNIKLRERITFALNDCLEYGYKGGEQNPRYALMLYGLSGTYQFLKSTEKKGCKKKDDYAGGGQTKTIVKKGSLFYFMPGQIASVARSKKQSKKYWKMSDLVFQYGYVLQGQNKVWGWMATNNLVLKGKLASKGAISLTPKVSQVGSNLTITVNGFDAKTVQSVRFNNGVDGKGIAVLPQVLSSTQLSVTVPKDARSGAVSVKLHSGEIIFWRENFFITTPLYAFSNESLTDHFFTITTDSNQFPPIPTGYNYQGIRCYILPKEVPFAARLYRQWDSVAQKHIYLTREVIEGAPSGVSVELGSVFRLNDHEPEILKVTHDDDKLGCKVFAQ